ncbi:MAG: helix-turn-helix domain-containing protein [Verrucomicrobia bacterium]|nr:helix-turn-helix domain-containing protein [Verrucomicrobiota bacterium]MCH8514301.1 helix-turn-helix domain-containing protein [Kiritimatiellia bacterium]
MKEKSPYLAVSVNRQMQSQVEIWQGVCEAADAAEWPHAIEEVTRFVQKLDEEACLGMLCWASRGVEEGRPFPVINLSNARGPLPNCGNLLNEDVAVGRLAAEHLLKNGYKDYLAIGMSRFKFSRERLEGLSSVLRAQGQTVREAELPELHDWAPEGRWNPQAFMDVMAEHLEPVLRELPPDAGIFAVDHPVAQHVEHCLFARFPERMHTTGLLSGDLPVFQRWLPGARRSISCVRTANVAKGRAAMEGFIRHGRNPDAVTKLCRFFEPEGVWTRVSTAGPACGHPVLARGIRWSWGRVQAGQPPSVEELASHLNMSARTLNRLFHQELQQTAREFLLSLRMERAAQVLREQPDWTIQRVAAEAGFTNQGAFASAFRVWGGQSPRDWRKT